MILFKQFIFTLFIINKAANALSDNSTHEECHCLNNGSCLSDLNCLCAEGFQGKNCEYTLCNEQDNQCQNGTCLIDTRSNIKLCKCHPFYNGGLCELFICSNYCYNNGECSISQFNHTDNSNSSSQFNLTCSCKSERFSGDRCQFDKCFNKAKKCPEHSFMGPNCQCLTDDDCDMNYCNNNGKCVHQSDNLICKCEQPFGGHRCEISKCENFCLNNGTCLIDKQTSEPFCNCTHGYNGTKCEDKAIFSSVYKARSSLKFFIYALAITFLVCLFVVGCYYSMHQANIKHLPDLDRIRRSTFSTRNRFQKDFGFSKLEDEQIIIQNEQFINA